jgi:hypothetical protein
MNSKKNSRKNKDESIQSIIDSVIKSYKLEGRMKDFDIINGWEEMMGKAVASRTDKIAIKNRVLILRLNSAVMREELMFGKQIIIDRVNQKVNEQYIQDIWFE